jgi:ketosteroid isomerase-like protein
MKGKVGAAVLPIALLAVVTFVGPLYSQPLYAQGPDPASIVWAYVEALNAHDLEAALALFADDAEVRVVPPPRGTNGAFRGKDEINVYLHRNVFRDVRVEVRDLRATGDRVSYTALVSNRSLEARRLRPVERKIEVVVRGGRISSYAATTASPSPRTVEASAPLVLGLGLGALLLVEIGLALGHFLPLRLRPGPTAGERR